MMDRRIVARLVWALGMGMAGLAYGQQQGTVTYQRLLAAGLDSGAVVRTPLILGIAVGTVNLLIHRKLVPMPAAPPGNRSPSPE